jgi:hypothetical protein
LTQLSECIKRIKLLVVLAAEGEVNFKLIAKPKELQLEAITVPTDCFQPIATIGGLQLRRRQQQEMEERTKHWH